MKKIYSLILSVIVSSGLYAQSLTAITPSSANQGETLEVSITGDGTNFTQASSSSLSMYFEFNQSSSTISITNISAPDDNTLTATVSVPEDETVGSYNLFVYNNVDGNLSLDDSLNGDNFCIEVQFISIPNKFLFEIDKVLEKYQIKIDQYFEINYIKSIFKDENIKFSEMVFKVQNGLIENEVKLVPKSSKKLGFFEKFFQLFS